MAASTARTRPCGPSASASAPRDYADALGRAVAKKLLEQDAGPLIAAVIAEQAAK